MPNGSTGLLISHKNKIFLVYALVWHNFMRYLHYWTQNIVLWNN